MQLYKIKWFIQRITLSALQVYILGNPIIILEQNFHFGDYRFVINLHFGANANFHFVCTFRFSHN